MKKIAIIILIFLIIIASIFSYYLYSTSKSSTAVSSEQNLELYEKIVSNSSWIYLGKDDFNGYLNGTYTAPVKAIIESLEEAIPVILQTSNDKFGDFENCTFIVASSFTSSNQVYVYYYNSETGSYSKSSVSLESLLEDVTAAYIYNETEDY